MNLLLLGFPVLNFASREAMIEQARSAWWGEAPEQPNRTQQGVSSVPGCREECRLTAEPLGGMAGIYSGRTLHNGLKFYIGRPGTLWTNGSDFATVTRLFVTDTKATSDRSAHVSAPIRSMDPHPLRASRKRLSRSGASPQHAERETLNGHAWSLKDQ